MSPMQTREEWDRRMDLWDFATAPPWHRFFINRERRARGQPPLRLREARAELRGRAGTAPTKPS